MVGRAFTFTHGGRTYNCMYDGPSAELLTIATSMIPTGPANSSLYRNMGSFRTYTMAQNEDMPSELKAYFSNVKPICFWIDGIEWDEDVVLDMATHLNFYMTYYDISSPRVNVHSPQSENVSSQPQTRFAFDKFPTSIDSTRIEDNLLHLWHASRSGDPARRFLYNYQIVEH